MLEYNTRLKRSMACHKALEQGQCTFFSVVIFHERPNLFMSRTDGPISEAHQGAKKGVLSPPAAVRQLLPLY